MFFAVLLALYSIFVSEVQATPVELLHDTNFSNGFGACFWLGSNFDPGPELMKYGLCHSYISSPKYNVKTIPNDDSATVAQNNLNKYWEVNDGIHEKDSNGKTIPDPFIHRFNINHHIINDLPSILNVEQVNPNTSQLIKQIASNRQGKIYLYYNSKNEIRNLANAYGSSFALDTWPTFQLSQNFRRYIDLVEFDQVNVSLQPRIISWTILPNWPSLGLPNTSPPEMSLNLYTFIRDRNNYSEGIFVGMALYSDNPTSYATYSSLDQFGQGFFRDNVALYGGPALPNIYTTIKFNLLQVIDKALVHAKIKKVDGSYKTHRDYVLSSFDLGFEGMGWFEGSVDIQNLSMVGITNSNYATPSTIVKNGDANSDSKINLLDFGSWKKEYLKQVNMTTADFDNNGKVDLIDFGIWKKAYLSQDKLN